MWSANSLAWSALRSAAALPTDLISICFVCDLTCRSIIGSFRSASMLMKRLRSSHSGSHMVLIESFRLSASILSIDDLESVQIVTFQDEGKIIDILVMASSSVL